MGGGPAFAIESVATSRWSGSCGGMKANDVRRLKELERENQTLKAIVADKELENVALKVLAEGNF